MLSGLTDPASLAAHQTLVIVQKQDLLAFRISPLFKLDSGTHMREYDIRNYDRSPDFTCIPENFKDSNFMVFRSRSTS